MQEEFEERTSELLAGYLAKDARAERALFRRYLELLLLRARRHPQMWSLRRDMSPEDAVQEVVERVLAGDFLQRFEYRGPGSLLAALSRILDNVLIDACRRRDAFKRGANAQAVSLDHGRGGCKSMVSEVASPDPTPTSAARARELVDVFHRHLEGREAEAWQLVEVEEVSHAEAATRMGVTPAAVRGLLFRARRKLVKALESASESEDGRVA